MRGFTLFEILIVIAILSILAVFSTGSYSNYTKSTELDFTAKEIKSDLKSMRGKAMSGEESKDWGIHFDNGASDFYELFSGSAYAGGTVERIVYLPGVITFSSPTIDIIFNNITGTTVSQETITISSGTDGIAITVSSEGNIN